MASSLSSLADNLSEINNKNPTDDFIGNIRSIITSLTYSVGNSSEINNKLEKLENEFTDKFRSISSSLSHSLDNLSEIKNNLENQKINLLIALVQCHRYY